MNCSNCQRPFEDESSNYCPHCGSSKSGPRGSNARPKGNLVRKQVLEVIVRQAMAGAPWRQICAEPMRLNDITEAEVLEEVERRASAPITEENLAPVASSKKSLDLIIVVALAVLLFVLWGFFHSH